MESTTLSTPADNQEITTLNDKLHRPLHDLRISIIDRCNFRCPYCMPENDYTKNYKFLKKEEWLPLKDVARLVKIFTELGVKKVRITGGEPLLRPGLYKLLQKLKTIKEIEDLALTTNGLLLAEHALELKSFGLDRLTVSLDSLDEQTFQIMNGRRGSLNQVLKGIRAAEQAGFDSLKINTVIQRGVNEHSILDLVQFFRKTKHVLRFIEYMDVGNCNHWESDKVVPSRNVLRKIEEKYPLEPLEANYFGEVAKRYRYKDGTGEIGFISSVSQPFCGSCTRARLSTDGKFYTCLFASKFVDLKLILERGLNDEDLRYFVKECWNNREDRYSEKRNAYLSSFQTSHKPEMFQIGG